MSYILLPLSVIRLSQEHLESGDLCLLKPNGGENAISCNVETHTFYLFIEIVSDIIGYK